MGVECMCEVVVVVEIVGGSDFVYYYVGVV